MVILIPPAASPFSALRLAACETKNSPRVTTTATYSILIAMRETGKGDACLHSNEIVPGCLSELYSKTLKPGSTVLRGGRNVQN